jgi:hypothetical protein
MGHLGLGVHQSMLPQSSSESGTLNCLKTIFCPTFRTLSVTLKYLTLKALTGKGYAILVQMNYLRLIENNLILLR